MPAEPYSSARLARAYAGFALSLLGVGVYVAALIYGFIGERWRSAFFLMLIAYPLGSYGDRMIDGARRDRDA